MIKAKIDKLFGIIKNFFKRTTVGDDSVKDITYSSQSHNTLFEKIPLERALENVEFTESEYKIPIIIGYDGIRSIKNALLDTILDVIPKEIFDDFSLYL